MADVSKRSGCGLLNAVFGKNKLWPRKAPSANSASSQSKLPGDGRGIGKTNTVLSSKRRRNIDHDPSSNNNKKVPASAHQQQQGNSKINSNTIKSHTNARQLPSSRNNMSVQQGRSPSTAQGQVQGGKTVDTIIGISGELENIIAEHQKAKGGNPYLVRASSGNVMLYGHLGNLRQPAKSNHANLSHSNGNSGGKGNPNVNASTRKEAAGGHTPTTPPPLQNGPSPVVSMYANSVMGNIVKKKKKNNNSNSCNTSISQDHKDGAAPPALCRALSCRMDPEDLKILGNEDYKNGRFAEALALYERAVDLEPDKASYRSNKSAALAALGRLFEAVFECREAIKIEPHYQRAHHRLATLYLRLGEAEKALHHFKKAGPEADPDANAKAKVVLVHIKKCDEAKRRRDWNTVLKESGNAISAGADSAPMMFALQAEAFLRLQRHQDADTALNHGPTLDVEQSTKFFGPAGNATLLMIRAQVDMAAGRFDEAMEAAEHAGRLDPSNREINTVMRRIRAVVASRSRGNELFKASKFGEACDAYSGGLEYNPCNSLLLCNRAACRSKLGKYDKAIEDCSAALNVRPCYVKARLRRADCYSKLGKWEAAVQDYEILMKESPEDEEVRRALFEAQIQVKKKKQQQQQDKAR